MCDYSLMAGPTRLANEGEQLVAHRFRAGSMGLASPRDLQRSAGLPDIQPRWSWTAIKKWFVAQAWGEDPVPAVCIPPGARLRVSSISEELRRELAVSHTEDVQFEQLTAAANTYRDAIRFQNGKVILLQRLREGQPVRVLSLGSPDVSEFERFELPALLQR